MDTNDYLAHGYKIKVGVGILRGVNKDELGSCVNVFHMRHSDTHLQFISSVLPSPSISF